MEMMNLTPQKYGYIENGVTFSKPSLLGIHVSFGRCTPTENQNKQYKQMLVQQLSNDMMNQ